MRNWFGSSTAVSLVLMLIAGRVSAGERRFTYVYESTTEKKGEWEFEQWVTWKTAKESNRDFDRFDFRTEIEYGVTDRLQLGLYVSDWRYEENRRENRHRGEWNNVALEGIWNLSDPNANFLGLALYGEVKVGDELLEVESKFIAQKNIGKLTLAYNAILEAEWEGHDYDEDNGELAQTFGLSYQVSPQFLAGAELLHELGIPDWRGVRGKAVLYLGPNFSYRAKKWWVTMTPLFQVSDIEDEPDFQARLLFGIPLGG